MARYKPATMLYRYAALSRHRTLIETGHGMTPDEAVEGLTLALALIEEMHTRLWLVSEAADFHSTVPVHSYICKDDPDSGDAT